MEVSSHNLIITSWIFSHLPIKATAHNQQEMKEAVKYFQLSSVHCCLTVIASPSSLEEAAIFTSPGQETPQTSAALQVKIHPVETSYYTLTHTTHTQGQRELCLPDVVLASI